jgi:carbonic anhydrase
MSSPDRSTAIVTCMDARLDAAGFLGDWPALVHVVRNAGGRVTADVLRSVAVSCAMGTERIVVIHHTQCRMAERTDEELRKLLPSDAAQEIDFLTIADPIETLRQDVQSIRDSPLLPSGIEVSGYIYDLESRATREIETEIR